tara:strand:- start:241 stop:1170 length:930 start_codon:yes stop_codon:yes gene_type:complete
MRVRVCNISFSKNSILVNKIKKYFKDVNFNFNGVRLDGEELIDFCKDADAIIVGVEKINSSILKRLPNLKYIAKYGVGIDNIDIDSCKERGVLIGWTGGVNKRSVAELTLGYMLILMRNIFSSYSDLKKLRWIKDGGNSLYNKKIGIIGMGNIGQDLIKLLSVFDCEILANDISENSSLSKKLNFKYVTKEFLYRNSDIVTLHVPLTSSTKKMINTKVFNKMKNSSILINTSRGGVVCEKDLIDALKNKKIHSAALDVFQYEPLKNKELVRLSNIICTPHIAGNSKEAVIEMGNSAISHLINFKNENHN